MRSLPSLSLSLVAEMNQLPVAIRHVAAFCEPPAIARDDALRLRLIVEELFTNTVMHGAADAGVATVWMGLSAEAQQIHIRYEDDAPPFDLLGRLDGAEAALEAPAHDRPLGRLGIPLVLSLASDIRYKRDAGRNQLLLTLPRRG